MARLVELLIVAAAGLVALLVWEQGSAGTSARPAVTASKRPAETLVFASRSNRLTAIDVASGRGTVRRIRSVASCGPDLHVTAGHVIFAGVRDGRTVVFSAPVSLDRPPTRLGSAHIFVPSATEGRVWLAGTDCTSSRMVGVRELTIDGRVTAESPRRVPATWIYGAIDDGLVITRDRALMVWDPSTGATGHRLSLGAVSATHGPLLAGCRGARCRRLAILDTSSGKDVVARPSGRYRLDWGAKFSPDGSLLAAPAYAQRRWRIALVDTRNGATRILPGSATGTTYPRISWSDSSGRLFIGAQRRHIMAYRPGAPRAVTLPFRSPRGALSFTAG
jgi:hypothetical protein